MPNSTTGVTGTVSELIAACALLDNGFEVSKPLLVSVYDFLALDPITDKCLKIQVKTAYARKDRGEYIVVYSKKGDKKPYTLKEADFIVAVHGLDVYMFRNTGQREYWCKKSELGNKWRYLKPRREG